MHSHSFQGTCFLVCSNFEAKVCTKLWLYCFLWFQCVWTAGNVEYASCEVPISCNWYEFNKDSRIDRQFVHCSIVGANGFHLWTWKVLQAVPEPTPNVALLSFKYVVALTTFGVLLHFYSISVVIKESWRWNFEVKHCYTTDMVAGERIIMLQYSRFVCISTAEE